jgi:very-short-patch-repair endonuclease
LPGIPRPYVHTPAVLIPLVERQKKRLLAFELGGHEYQVRVHREMDQCPLLKAKDRLTCPAPAPMAALKTFLNYAQTGQMDVPNKTDRLPDSEFEDQVFRQLTALGYEVHTQVGSAGFFLDLAVIDPAHPGRYLLGIECDGARYHSARSARDRDRLRQAVLVGLGWRIHRIWSTDWFHSPDQELRKVVQAIEVAQTATPAPPHPPASAEETGSMGTPPLLAPTQSTRKPSITSYECAHVHLQLGDVDMHLVSRTQLADLLAQVVNVESPVHWMEAARRVLDGAGIHRFGNRIQQAFEQAVRVGVDHKLFVKRAEFLWASTMQQSPVRNRSELPAASRKLEFVAPEEVRRAILIVVEESYGIVPTEVPSAVCRLFGFARVTDEMSAAVEPHRDALVREGYLKLQGVNLVAVSLARPSAEKN